MWVGTALLHWRGNNPCLLCSCNIKYLSFHFSLSSPPLSCRACTEGSICTPCLSYQRSLRFPLLSPSLSRSLSLSVREEFGQQLRQPSASSWGELWNSHVCVSLSSFSHSLQLMPLLSLESTAVEYPGALTQRTKHLLSPSALCSSNSSRPQHKPRRKEGESGSKGWKRRRERWESEGKVRR